VSKPTFAATTQELLPKLKEAAEKEGTKFKEIFIIGGKEKV